MLGQQHSQRQARLTCCIAASRRSERGVELLVRPLSLPLKLREEDSWPSGVLVGLNVRRWRRPERLAL